MARVKRIENSRKAHVCGRGGHEIPKGDPYLTASPGYRGRPKYRCIEHPFRPSELTTSMASEPMAAVEAFEDAAGAGFDSIEDLTAAWDELKEAVESYRDQRQEALDAWEYGNAQLEEYVETAESAVQEVEGFTPEEFGDEEPEEPGDEPDIEEEPDVHETWEALRDEYAEWEANRDQHIEEQTEEALTVAGSLEF